MYQRILAPLDGSKVAEGVLPQVCELAKTLNAELVLVRVSPTADSLLGHGIAVGGSGALDAQLEQASSAYLTQLASTLDAGAKPVRTVSLRGPVAETIVSWATMNGVDLIALMSHGLGHAARWVFGSVADRLLQSSPIPVLVLRATADQLEAQEELEERELDASLLRALGEQQAPS